MQSSSHAAKRHKVERSCLAASSAPKVVLARILLALQAEGCLVEGLIDSDADEHKVRKDIASAASELTSESTPFGPIVQTMTFNTTPPFSWKYMHPLALLYKLSTVAPGFASLLKRCVDAYGELSIVLYVDEIRPGNILRPDYGRATQNIFWTFSEFPEWFLKRDDGWFTVGGLRTAMLQNIGCDMSSLMTRVLHTFWNPAGANFQTTGGMFVVGNEHVIVKSRFAGFLGDEKAIKEVFASKGPGGTKPCLSCKNVVQHMDEFLEPDGYLVSVKTADPSRFDSATDDDVFEMADHLRARVGVGSKQAFEDLQQHLGLNYVADGILYDGHCRQLVRPVSGWYRDWMHVMCVAGVANIELEQVIHALRDIGVQPQTLTSFFSHIRLPKSMGKIDKEWFTKGRVGKPHEQKDGWKGFSSELLAIIPIMMHFLQTAIEPTGQLPNHIRCFQLLDRMLKLFSLGAETAANHIRLIENTIKTHAEAFAEIYGHVAKPKFHHLFHVVDHARNMNRLISCFVTERKHKTIKHIANHLFRNFETALTTDLLNLTVERYSTRPGLFCPESLHNPRPMTGAAQQAILRGAGIGSLSTSFRADLTCGCIDKADFIMLPNRSVGRVVVFAATGEGIEATIVCVVTPLRCIGAHRHRHAGLQPIVVNAADIVDSLVWYEDGEDVCVLPPRQSATW